MVIVGHQQRKVSRGYGAESLKNRSDTGSDVVDDEKPEIRAPVVYEIREIFFIPERKRCHPVKIDYQMDRFVPEIHLIEQHTERSAVDVLKLDLTVCEMFHINDIVPDEGEFRGVIIAGMIDIPMFFFNYRQM
jgi:hypothetical protein